MEPLTFCDSVDFLFVYCYICFNIVLRLIILCSSIMEMRKKHLFLIVLQIVIIEHKSIICPGYNAVLHIHTCIEEVEITVSSDANVDNLLFGVRSSVVTYIAEQLMQQCFTLDWNLLSIL